MTIAVVNRLAPDDLGPPCLDCGAEPGQPCVMCPRWEEKPMPATPKLNAALAAFQAKLPDVAKEATGNWGKYADLADVAKAVLPVLGEHGLAYIAEPMGDDQGRLVMPYALLHASGEQRGGVFPLYRFLPERATSQAGGGAVTYWRRYLLLALTGVHPHGEDDDGQEASRQPPVDGSATHVYDVPMANPGGYTLPQQIARRFGDLGVTDRGVILGYVQTLIGREVASANELTRPEQLKLKSILDGCRTRDGLDELRDKAMEAS